MKTFDITQYYTVPISFAGVLGSFERIDHVGFCEATRICLDHAENP
jgi:hypothetical protein